MAQVMKEGNFINLPVFQYEGYVFNGQDAEVAGEAERNFRKHGMNIRVPENMPSPQGLTNINRQNQQGRAVADKTDQHGKIDDVFQCYSF